MQPAEEGAVWLGPAAPCSLFSAAVINGCFSIWVCKFPAMPAAFSGV